jgi:hypothetical protein
MGSSLLPPLHWTPQEMTPLIIDKYLKQAEVKE